MAEVARPVGVEAARFDLPKPSYVHLRRSIVAHRKQQDAEAARRQEILAILGDVNLDMHRGRVVDAYEVADRAREVGLVAQSRKLVRFYRGRHSRATVSSSER